LGLVKKLLKPAEVLRPFKDGLPLIAARDHVEQCAGKMNARLSHHTPSLAWKDKKTNNQSLTPLHFRGEDKSGAARSGYLELFYSGFISRWIMGRRWYTTNVLLN
jgi:hypothetical protein